MGKKMFIKLLVLGGLSLLLLMALCSIGNVTRERKHRLEEVKYDIAQSYAGHQRIIGPVVQLQFRERWISKLYNAEKDLWYEKEMHADTTRLVYPKTLSYQGALDVQERYRGIFKASVFKSTGTFSGEIHLPALSELHVEKESEIESVSATAFFLISDARGISSLPSFTWGDHSLKIIPGSGLKNEPSGLHVELPNPTFGAAQTFNVQLDVHGMGSFEIVPIGADNQIELESSWSHPSFIGDFLASERTISDDGFTAKWSVNGLACSARQNMSADQMSNLQTLGVSLVDPVNVYPLTDRALKYGFLFIFITFAAFFLFELLKQLKIHPVQYGFVGLAQSIFFLLLISLSEHIGFGVAYALASAATIGIIAFYICGVLKSLKHGLVFGAVLSLLYGTLFGLLQSEDHALMAGSALLFGLLAFIMILTRNVDWYALSTKPEGKTK